MRSTAVWPFIGPRTVSNLPSCADCGHRRVGGSAAIGQQGKPGEAVNSAAHLAALVIVARDPVAGSKPSMPGVTMPSDIASQLLLFIDQRSCPPKQAAKLSAAAANSESQPV
jgi:hypothetical protein